VTQREVLVLAACGLLLLLAVSSMYAMHEKHYRTRADRIKGARASGHIEDRVAALEAILAEDRLT